MDAQGRPLAGTPVVRTFRKRFRIDDPATVVAAFAEVRFAGGIVVSLNGTEWFRSNVDPEHSGSDDPASEPEPEGYWIRHRQRGIYQRSFPGLDPRPLVAGPNTLVVRLHRPRDPDADPLVYFDFRLDLFTSHGFVVAPYLTISAEDTAVVAWDTAAPTLGRVRCASGPDSVVESSGGDVCAVHHEVRIPRLDPPRTCAYEIEWAPCGDWVPESDRRPRSTPAGSVRPLPPPGKPVVFFAYGDSRHNPRRHGRVVQAMLREAEANGWPAFLLHTGDLTDSGTAETEWLEQFFRPLAPLLAHVPIAPVLGNHEYKDEDWFLRFSLPGNEAWFSFRAGHAEIFVVDAYSGFRAGSAQLRWLEGALAASTAPWKIVTFHPPLRSCGTNRVRQREADSNAEWLVPILLGGGVRLVLTGHDHLYGRAFLEGGLLAVTLGGGGAPLYRARRARQGEVCVSTLHFARIEVDASRLHVRVLDTEGNQIDEIELTREPDALPGHSTPVHEPAAPAAPVHNSPEGGAGRGGGSEGLGKAARSGLRTPDFRPQEPPMPFS